MGLNLEQKLAEVINADLFSQNPRLVQKTVLEKILGENSVYIEPIVKSVDEVSVIMLNTTDTKGGKARTRYKIVFLHYSVERRVQYSLTLIRTSAGHG